MENIVLRHSAVCDVTITMAPTSASYRAQVVLNRGCSDVSSNQIKEFVNGKSWKVFSPFLPKNNRNGCPKDVNVDFIFLDYLQNNFWEGGTWIVKRKKDKTDYTSNRNVTQALLNFILIMLHTILWPYCWCIVDQFEWKNIQIFSTGSVSPRNRLEEVELVRAICRSAKGRVLHTNLNLDD